MGFARIDERVTHDEQIAGAVLRCEAGVEIALSGDMMFAGCFGFDQSLSWFFFCAVNGRDGYVLERENCDCGEGWFLYDWSDQRPHCFTGYDDAVHTAMCASKPALENKYLHRIAGIKPWSIQPADNEHCLAIRRVIEGTALDRTAWIQ